MRILHLPTEIAGQAGITAKAQRSLGHHAYNLAYPHPFGYPIDISIKKFSNRWINGLNRLKVFAEIAEEYDVYHYHFGATLLPGMLDVSYLKLRNKRFLVEFWGSDVRLPDLEAQRNPYFVNQYEELEKKNRKRMATWAELTEGEVIFSDHTFNIFLEQYFDKIHIIGQRIDLETYIASYPDPESKKPRVIHAPSQKAIKGTVYVEKAVENLKKKGLDFDYIRVENLNHSKAIELYRTADLIIDQLCAGTHGIFACEAMALGKPVICYILPELVSGYPKGFPIINANPDTIESVLEEWIQKPYELYILGKNSRKYVEKVHDSKVVAQKLINISKTKKCNI
jgi:glycosyltransferase involved in cell wall biosynthesis